MSKFFAVVKHEYKKVVLKWSFLIGTFLLPFLAACMTFVPALIFSIKGEPTKIAVVDPSGKIFSRLNDKLATERISEKTRQAAVESLSNIDASQTEKLRSTTAQFAQQYRLELVDAKGLTPDAVRTLLVKKIMDGDSDAYLIIPNDPGDPDAQYEFRSRRGGDMVGNEVFEDAVNDAVRSQRLSDAKISEDELSKLSSKVTFDTMGLDESGREKSSEGIWVASFIIGLMIYITLTIYGQAIMAAVVEEKETRIAEILFSSARPFELMMGKLVGVGLAGLTQLGIWVTSAAALVGVAIARSGIADLASSVPTITPVMIVYFLVFFLLGFFLYASIFALIGSMVTTVQEGGQFAFPPIMIMLAAFYFSFLVIRDPNSNASFWASVAPFLSPITMPVRILAETPPLWQILLAIGLDLLAIIFLVWVASRVYRVGMLMYGKRATIPEVFKWIRQA